MRNLAIKKPEKGFTLIEIVLVLAIAGLIMLIVFLAVSGAQKSRRDTQRKEDLSKIAAQIESYASNNGGVYPTAANINGIMTGAYKISTTDPLNGGTYTYGGLVTPAGGTPAGVLYTPGGPGQVACDNVTALTGVRTFKVQMGLEQGTGCVDNH